MDDIHNPQEERNRKRGLWLSILVHITLVLMGLLPILTYPDPPPGQEGILVNLGLPDQGQGIENAAPSQPPQPEERDEPEPQPERELSEPERQTEPAPVEEREVVKTEDPDQVAIEEEERRKQEEAERQRRQEEARRKAQEEAERQRREEERRKQEEADQLKDELGGLFGQGEGKGDTGEEGNQGDPQGDPDAEKLEGLSSGVGNVGGGLSGRGVTRNPKPNDTSQKEGAVVVRVCVNAAGDVISAEYTLKGSSTQDATLKRIAVENARKWKFSPGEVERQCGTITYRFKVR